MQDLEIETEKYIQVIARFPSNIHEEIVKYQAWVRIKEGRKLNITEAVVELTVKGLSTVKIMD
jgi:hypothetical protein